MDKLHKLYIEKLNRQTKELNAMMRANDFLKNDKQKLQDKVPNSRLREKFDLFYECTIFTLILN